eukprot:gene15636-17214_t
MSTPEPKQRLKRGLPFTTGTTPAKKAANLINKQISAGKIPTNSDHHATPSTAVKMKARPSPGNKLHPSTSTRGALTPTTKKTCQRILKKSSSYCGKNMRSEARVVGSVVDRNAFPIRHNVDKKMFNTPLSESKINSSSAKSENRIGMASPVSLKNEKHVKSLFKGKKNRQESIEVDFPSKSPHKRLEIGSDLREAILEEGIVESNTKSLTSPGKSIAEIKPSRTPLSKKYIDNGSPFSVNRLRKQSDTGPGDFSVHVAVRVRPFSEREKDNPDVYCVVEMYDTSTCITESNGHSHQFTFDMSYWSFDAKDPTHCDQGSVYRSSAQPLLDGVLQGCNTCLFAYGQTGSGKSYSMMGYHDSDVGIIPRFCEELFEKINETCNVKFAVEISFFEIYNERIRDLLSYGNENKKQLRVREHPEHGPYVQDLSMFTVKCYSDIETWLAVGNQNRATAATGMNDKSSRSHSVFTINLRQTQDDIFEGSDTQLCRSSKVNLIDLAGSEKASYINNEQNQEQANNRLKEGSCINKSLHTLGKVISLLSEQQTGSKKRIFVPYRESVLTWLLKESLGGNSRTAMIATISPANIHSCRNIEHFKIYDEGEGLYSRIGQYASQARNIVNQVRVNEDSNSKLIRELLSEIERLKSLQQNPCQKDNDASEIEILRRKLKDTTVLLTESTRAWDDKPKVSESKQKEEAERLRRSGVAFNVDNTLPNLVNLNEDPMLSEVLVYTLKEGITTFGNSQSEQDTDIKLDGPLVADYHCHITYELKQVRITPIGDALTFVNGEQISANFLLRHGDRIVIGGTHFFGFNQPCNSKSNKREARKKWDGLTLKDFEFAKKELTTQQNAKLEAELEESQVKAQQQRLVDLITNVTASSEKQIYLQKQEHKEEISNLQKLLEETENKKKLAEENQQIAEDQIMELKSEKDKLFKEILLSRQKFQDETKTAKEVLEETKENQLDIITELESEKRRIEDNVRRLKTKKVQREVVRNEIRSALSSVNTNDTEKKRDLLKIALLLREANKVSEKLGKCIIFSRDDILEGDKVEIRVRLNDTKLGKTTLWSLEKFEYMVGKMRELYQTNGMLEEGSEDPFCNPDDDWVEDFMLDSPTASEENGSRMSTGKRYSLNHSLNMLTNLNASLSGLSARRRSSFFIPNQIKETNDAMSPMCILRDVLQDEPVQTDDISICGRLMRLVSDAHRECAHLMQASLRTSNSDSKSMLKIAILIGRIKECLSTWSLLNTSFHGDILDNIHQNVQSSLTRLTVDLKAFVETANDSRWQLNNNTERLLGTLRCILKNSGQLCLGFADSYKQHDTDFLTTLKDPMLFELFIDGQRTFWNTCTRGWESLIEHLTQQLQQIQDRTQIDDDVDKWLEILNSTSYLMRRLHDFMMCFLSMVSDTETQALTEGHLCSQRGIVHGITQLISNLKRSTFALQVGFDEDELQAGTTDTNAAIKIIMISIVDNCNGLMTKVPLSLKNRLIPLDRGYQGDAFPNSNMFQARIRGFRLHWSDHEGGGTETKSRGTEIPKLANHIWFFLPRDSTKYGKVKCPVFSTIKMLQTRFRSFSFVSFHSKGEEETRRY